MFTSLTQPCRYSGHNTLSHLAFLNKSRPHVACPVNVEKELLALSKDKRESYLLPDGKKLS